MLYLRIISCDVAKRKYTDSSIHANIYLSIFDIVSVMYWLNYSIKVSVECWPHCHVRYRFVGSFSVGLKWFCKQRFIFNVFKIFFFTKIRFKVFFIRVMNVYTSAVLLNGFTLISGSHLERVGQRPPFAPLCPISHRRHGQDKTVLSCPCERNWRQVKTVVSSPQYIWDWTVLLQTGNRVETRQNSVHTTFRDRIKLSCPVAISVHTADTDKTSWDSSVLSVVWTRHYGDA